MEPTSIQQTRLQPRKYSEMADSALVEVKRRLQSGCHSVFHREGYMNIRGTAPYDFTCDSSHLCQPCHQQCSLITSQLARREKFIVDKQNQQRTQQQLELVKIEYFNRKNCECKSNQMCKECLDRVQGQVTRLQRGCGKGWQTQFGGMAAGPGTVYCYNNTFLCDQCTQKLALIKRVAQDYPHVCLRHMPEGDTYCWKGRDTKLYFEGHL